MSEFGQYQIPEGAESLQAKASEARRMAQAAKLIHDHLDTMQIAMPEEAILRDRIKARLVKDAAISQADADRFADEARVAAGRCSLWQR